MMRLFRLFCVSAVLFLVFSGCSSKGNDENGNSNPQTAPIFNINDQWQVQSKTCASKDISVTLDETLKIDDTHLVMVRKLSEDSTTFCKVAHVYDRIINSYLTGSVYQESATLRSSSAKKVCWRKVDGAVIGEPIEQKIFQFGPEQIAMKLNRIENQVALQLLDSPLCAEGTLEIRAQRRQQ